MSTTQRTLFNSYAGPGSLGDLSIDSRFLPLLKDNDLLPAVVLRELDAEMKEPLQALIHIEAEIQELESALALLGRRRDGLRGAISVYSPILSPIRTLPDDVLQGIFIHCLPTSRNARPFTSEAPLLLTLVCKKWRTLAFASPRLWRTLHLQLDFHYNPSSPLVLTTFSHIISPMIPLPRVAELHAARRIELERWLHRSGALPLSISLFYPRFQFGRTLNDRPPSKVTQTMDLIARYADRLSILELEMPSHILQELGVKLAPYGASRSLPLLKRLRVLSDEMHVTQPYASGQRSVHDDGFGMLSASSLQELSVWVAPSLFHTRRIHRFTHLTVLSLNSTLDVGIVHHILSQCSSLLRCSLNIVKYDTDQGWPYVPVSANDVVPQPIQTTIRLEHLETLAIRGEISNIGFLCRPLEASSMQHLLLYPYRMDDLTWEVGQGAIERELDLPYPPESTGDLCRYVSQCSSLQSLTINPDSLFASEIQSIFQSVKNISTLVLDNNFTGRPAGPRMTQSSLHTPMLPTGPSSIITFGVFKYHLHPLLKQERVVKSTGQRIPLSQPLLPNIKSFTWHQFSLDCIPNDFLVGFITSRLQPAVLNTEAGRIDYEQLASLNEINVKLLKQSDATDIGAKITQFAQQMGLTPGSDFSLSITAYPWADCLLQPKVQYAAPQVRSEPSSISEDNLIFNYDVTWPLFEI